MRFQAFYNPSVGIMAGKHTITSLPARPSGRVPTRLRRLRRRLLGLLVAILTTTLLLGLLEAGLRLGGYGYDTRFLASVGKTAAAYTSNETFGWRFFPRAVSNQAYLLWAPVKRAGDTVRVVILGESAIRGEPEPAFSAGRFLQAMLERTYPRKRIEVINTAMPAINSHVVWPIAREVVDRLHPDVVVVYMGNNEVMGPFGAGTVFTPISPSLRLIRLGLWLKTTRVGQLCANLIGANPPELQGPWPGLPAFMEQTVRADHPGLQHVYRHYRRNLQDIIAAARSAGVPVVVSTVAVNLTACAPFTSVHREDLSKEELAEWTDLYQEGVAACEAGQFETAESAMARAARIDETYAELRYRLATCLAAQGEMESAEVHFAAARDYDALRLRADGTINRIIRDVARGKHDSGVFLVDAEIAFQAHRPRAPAHRDRELFFEHVHFRPEGNYLLARTLLPSVIDALSLDPSDRSPPSVAPTFEDCAARLGLSGWDRHDILEPVLTITGRAPFTNQFDHAQQQQSLLTERAQLSGYATGDGLVAAIGRYRHALSAHEDDLFLHERFTALLLNAGRFEEAIQHARVVLVRLPGNTDMKLNLAVAHAQVGNWDQAHATFAEYLAERRCQQRAPTQLAADCQSAARICLGGQRPSDAIMYCRQALEFVPRHPQSLVTLGYARKALGMSAEAQQAFQDALAAEDQSVQTVAHRELGGLLLADHRPQEALVHLQAALDADPEHLMTLLDAAVAYQRMGLFAPAAEMFERAVQSAPDRIDLRVTYADLLQLAGRARPAAIQYQYVLNRQPAHPSALNGLAWLLATTSDQTLRDGVRAVKLARRVVAIQTTPTPETLDTLAAACAATGDFQQARTLAIEARDLAAAAGRDTLAREIAERVALYDQGRSFLQPNTP